MTTLRIGIVGLGANTRLRHVPGLLACEDVEIVAVCNRRPESTAAAAREFDIPKTFSRWEDLVADADVDAVVIGTWPYLHCPITLAALASGKHVLTEARMAMNATEARQMLAASREHPELVTQIVPSPLGMKAGRVVKELLDQGYIGQLREVVVLGTNDEYADQATPLHWRQSAQHSGLNMLLLGILHETLTRWVPQPVRVLSHTHTFTPERPDAETGKPSEVSTPDSVHVLTELPEGAQGIYHLSGAIHFGPSAQIHLYGSKGTLKYLLAPENRLLGARRGEKQLREIDVPPEKESGWRVEAEFVDATRGLGKVELTDFATGVAYMDFTEAVAQSADSGSAISLPLA